MRRILVIHTTRDGAVDDRIEAISKRPALADYTFHHAFIFVKGDISGLGDLKPSEFIQQNVLKIFNRLHQELQSTSPDVVLLHTGLAFSFAPQAIVSIFSRLKEENQQVRFGIQGGSVFDKVLAMEGIEFADRVFRLFDFGDDIEGLAKLVF